MDSDFDDAEIDLLTDIAGRLGLADVAEFGLRWQTAKNSVALATVPKTAPSE